MNMVGVRMYLDFPLLGGGLNNFQNLSDKYDKTGVFFYFDVVPHNIFVLIGSETGALGLLAFLGMGLCLLVQAASLLKKTENEYCFILGASGMAVLVGIAMANTVDNTLRNDLVLAQCTLIAALIMSAKGSPAALKMKRKIWNE
jgi:O-antigen ligase